MKRRRVSLLFALLVLAALLAACGNGGTETAPPDTPADDPVSEAEVPAESAAAEPAAEEPAEADAAPDPTATTEIIHMTMPGSFQIAALQRIFDCDTSSRAFAGNLVLSTICDRWPENYLERPMTMEDGDYHPELDIIKVEFGQDADWFYVRIYLNPAAADTGITEQYFVEIDTNLDGRGDVLLLVSNPAQGEADTWSVAGVQVWQDQNGDVGGDTAVLADGAYSGDGYETLLFDSGAGTDPDLAWARVSTEVPGLVELAFKPRMIDNAPPFAWWAGAYSGDLPIGAFDLVDSLDEATAFLLDNTCGWIFGSSGASLPNMCDVIAAPTAVPQPGVADTCSPPPEGCREANGGDPCWVWYEPTCSCVCFN